MTSLRAEDQRNARFVTAVLPSCDAGAEPRLSVDRLADGTLTVTLDWSAVGDGGIDRIVWRRGGARIDEVVRADAAWTRTDRQGALVMCCAAGIYQPGDTHASDVWVTDAVGAGLRFGRGRTS